MHLEFMLVMVLDVAGVGAMIRVYIPRSLAYPNLLKSVLTSYYLIFMKASEILSVA